ncbi:cytidylyltransferase domain-containing protein [Arcobacter cloacae]|uniref:Acylneuraminate cytidylyltransferase n=1 Tax=Arcobacter cloacae TaxID=1054034 RepID=A0A6M8NKZ5_9BACT|nr:acylneuraminate cytidylyltransferase family protein [Arcobacter cloacae]QKF90601.1 acylneuraminate cytidylyltransferase family protein [Arcobacter cloacae]RXI37581.1 acylneuraminate cytidylyltransferase [Arcobacter cloacae]
MNKFTAIIPVRAGSRRLKDKNISKFADSNLLEYKIDILKKVKYIDNIVVSSDSELMLEMAQAKNVSIHKRELKYCDEKTEPFGAVVKHICESVQGENIIWAPVTAPLISIETYLKSLELYIENVIDLKKYDSLISVEPFKRYVWNKNGPINYELGLKHVPSQELEELYFISDGILIAPRIKMIEWAYFHGANPYKMPLNRIESVDIDDGMDLELAKFYYNNYIKNKHF